MKVAFLSYDFGEYCVRQASAMARHAQVLLMLPRRLAAPHESLLDPAVEFHPFDPPRLRQPMRQAFSIRSLLARIRQFQPDVIHFQRGHLWFNLALPLLRRYPLVLTAHDPRHHLGDRGSHKTPQAIMDFGCRRAAQVIVHGQQLRQTVTDEIGVPADRVHVVPHVAIGERPLSKAVEEEAGLVLFFGRIWEYKGLDYLIRAAPRIAARAPHARFLIAGRGEDFERYEELMVERERFEVHNRWISDEERAEMFQRASVVVLPYVEATQSGVVPVAYTYARPVVATATGGLPDAVEHGRTGLLVPPRDEAALADAVATLLNDPGLRRQMGESGKRKLETEASPEAVVQQTLEVYRKAIDQFHSSRGEPSHHESSLPVRA